jgi:hypothetical protein
MTDDDRRGNMVRVLTKPHIQAGDIYIRLILIMYEGRWVVATSANQPPLVLEALGLLNHPYFYAAIRWMDEANARLAKRQATEAIDQVMRL